MNLLFGTTSGPPQSAIAPQRVIGHSALQRKRLDLAGLPPGTQEMKRWCRSQHGWPERYIRVISYCGVAQSQTLASLVVIINHVGYPGMSGKNTLCWPNSRCYPRLNFNGKTQNSRWKVSVECDSEASQPVFFKTHRKRTSCFMKLAKVLASCFVSM